MDIQSIVDEIKKLCFSKGASIGGNPHTEFLMNLSHLLQTLNYRVEHEYSVSFNHLTLRTGRVQSRHGLIDLYAERATDLYGRGKNHAIAIEYDDGWKLKYKSIEKLIQSKADTLIGIVSKGLLNHSKERILLVMNRSGIVNRKVLLIAVGENASQDVYLKT